MKKLVSVLIVLILFLVGCHSNTTKTTNKIKITDIESMAIKTLPSPPKMKMIDKNEDIEKVIKHINSIAIKKTIQEEVKGWEIYVQTYGKQEHTISFLGNLINIDDVWYKISDDEMEKFRDLYNSLNYEEETINYKLRNL